MVKKNSAYVIISACAAVASNLKKPVAKTTVNPKLETSKNLVILAGS